jgi:hypothetical protein
MSEFRIAEAASKGDSWTVYCITKEMTRDFRKLAPVIESKAGQSLTKKGRY